MGGFVEIVEPTMFNKSKGDAWQAVVCRFDHKSEFLLGTTAAEILRCASTTSAWTTKLICPDAAMTFSNWYSAATCAQAPTLFARIHIKPLVNGGRKLTPFRRCQDGAAAGDPA